MEKIRNQEIYNQFNEGKSAEDIARDEGISRARVYQIVNQMKIKERGIELPIIDDSRKVRELMAERTALKEEKERLYKIIDKLMGQ